MIDWHLVIPWLRSAWPSWAVIPFFVLHFLALRYIPAPTDLINKAAGATLQVIGGGIVLYSINDNLGLFRQQSFLAAISSYFRSFPFKRPPITLSATGVSSSASFGSATLSVGRVTTTLEKRVEEIERKLKDHIEQNQKDHNSIIDKLQTHKADLDQMIYQNSDRINNLDAKLEHAAVGGFKLQSFGVLLAIYGAFTSVFA